MKVSLAALRISYEKFIKQSVEVNEAAVSAKVVFWLTQKVVFSAVGPNKCDLFWHN